MYREERARQYAREEEEAIARGEVETIYVEEFRCEMCKKTFKKEGGLDDHLNSKKHKQQEAKLKAQLQLDPTTEGQLDEREKAREEKLRKEEEESRAADEQQRRIMTEEYDESRKKKTRGKNQAKEEEEEKA